MLPIVDVEGVGAAELPVPPVATVYHNKFVPVAVSADAVAFWQYVTGLAAAGAAGIAFTFITIAALGLSQPLFD